MLVGNARLKSRRLSVARAGYSCGLTVLLLLFGSRSLQTAVAEGDTRTITLHHIHTDEDITITYKRDGRYDEAALEKLNWFLRDWRREEATRMDPHLIDLIWEVRRETGSNSPVWVVCGYRSPKTNAMLRRRSRGVARFSQHMLGHAMDFYIPGVSLEQLRVIGLRLQRGGVGFYPSSGSPFVHMDTASVRHWPRMTREELVRVFPSGRTVHIPTDGRPLSGYSLALADIRRRGGTPSETSLEAARSAGVEVASTSVEHRSGGLFARLLGLHKHDDDEEEDSAASTTTASNAPAQQQVASASAPTPAPVSLRTRAKVAVVAAIERAEDKLAVERAKLAKVAARTHVIARAEAAPLAAVTPNDVIRARGYWQGLPDGVSAVQAAAVSGNPLAGVARPLRTEVASADPASTGTTEPSSDRQDDRVPPQLALAYAEQPERALPTRSAVPRAPIAAGSTPRVAVTNAVAVQGGENETVAIKRVRGRSASVILTVANRAVAALEGAYAGNPWLRAIALSPSVLRYLTTTSLGVHDLHFLTALMAKPSTSVMMTFSAEPQSGLALDHFSGNAIVFVSTVTYPTHTALR